jgi:hypothetical protein
MQLWPLTHADSGGGAFIKCRQLGPFTHAAVQPGEEEELVVDKPDEAAAGHAVRDGTPVRVHRVQKIVVPQLKIFIFMYVFSLTVTDCPHYPPAFFYILFLDPHGIVFSK